MTTDQRYARAAEFRRLRNLAESAANTARQAQGQGCAGIARELLRQAREHLADARRASETADERASLEHLQHRLEAEEAKL